MTVVFFKFEKMREQCLKSTEFMCCKRFERLLNFRFFTSSNIYFQVFNFFDLLSSFSLQNFILIRHLLPCNRKSFNSNALWSISEVPYRIVMHSLDRSKCFWRSKLFKSKISIRMTNSGKWFSNSLIPYSIRPKKIKTFKCMNNFDYKCF